METGYLIKNDRMVVWLRFNFRPWGLDTLLRVWIRRYITILSLLGGFDNQQI